MTGNFKSNRTMANLLTLPEALRRLATLIEIGSAGRQQAYKTVEGEGGAVCAFGAAWYGMGLEAKPQYTSNVAWQLLAREGINLYAMIPSCDDQTVFFFTATLNDEKELPFSVIASRLREAADALPPESPQVIKTFPRVALEVAHGVKR